MMEPNNNKIYFKNLDALRTIAALTVFFWHAYGLAILALPDGFVKYFLLTIFNGDMGVSIFFVLSGFLITYLILQEVKKDNSFSLRHFYLRRVLRIWPLYFGLLIFSYFILLPLLARYSNIDQKGIMDHSKYYFFFVSNLDSILGNGKGTYVPVGITWSVAIEEQFYLLWPLLFFFVSPKKYIYVLFGTLIASLVFKIYYYNNIPFIKYHSISAVTNLSIGGLAAYFAIHKSAVGSIFKKPGYIYLAGLALIFTDNIIDFTGKDALFKTLEALFFAFVILDQCYNSAGKFRIGNSRWLTKLGKYTYGIYMLHALILYFIGILCTALKLDEPVRYILNLLLGLPLVILLAWLSYEFYEKKFLHLKEKFGYRNLQEAKKENIDFVQPAIETLLKSD